MKDKFSKKTGKVKGEEGKKDKSAKPLTKLLTKSKN